MNIGLILAGGTGVRMGSSIPKQFIEVGGKSILAYTIEQFEKHRGIDKIVVVCMPEWEEYIWTQARLFGFSKLEKMVSGGESALESIKNGIAALDCAQDDIIVIHDGVRPLVDEASIDAVLEDCRVYGGAISAVPLIEHVVYIGEDRTDLHYIPRENAYRTITPQAYKYGLILKAFKKSEETGIGRNSAFIGTMMLDLGEKVCLSKGNEKNIKITSPKDLVYFQSSV